MSVAAKNIFLWLLSTILYSLVAWWLMGDQTLSVTATTTLLIAALCAPVTTGNTVFTIAGNAYSEGDLISLFSVYQNAKKNALAVIHVGCQNAGQDAWQGLGLTYQNVGKEAYQFIGVAYQNAGEYAGQVIGLAYQNAGMKAQHGIGFVVQYAKKYAENVICVAFWQQAGDKKRSFAVWSCIETEEDEGGKKQ